jgi:competence protein ComEA
MLMRKLSLACAVAALTASVAFAQPKPTTAPTPPAATSTTAPAVPATKATKPAASTVPSAIPAGTKVNLNTATADQLDALPQVGKTRSKEIMTERAKGNFKDWNDFDTRTAHSSINKGVKAKIKNLVTF